MGPLITVLSPSVYKLMKSKIVYFPCLGNLAKLPIPILTCFSILLKGVRKWGYGNGCKGWGVKGKVGIGGTRWERGKR